MKWFKMEWIFRMKLMTVMLTISWLICKIKRIRKKCNKQKDKHKWKKKNIELLDK